MFSHWRLVTRTGCRHYHCMRTPTWLAWQGDQTSADGLQALDGRSDTKWLDFGGSGGRTTWLAFALPKAQAPVRLASYSLTSGNDSPERDPRDWVLEGRASTGTGGLAHALLLDLCKRNRAAGRAGERHL